MFVRDPEQGLAYPSQLIEQARSLRRKEGIPYRQLAARLGVSVATAYSWTRDIQLSTEHRKRNAVEAQSARAKMWRARNRRRRLAFQQEGRARARRRDRLHMAGCMLYWAEGSKGRNALEFANSDPAMMTFFRRFLTDSLEVGCERLCFTVNVYLENQLTLAEIENHWLGVLALPRTAARKHCVDYLPSSSSGSRKEKLPHGVCALKLYDTRIVQHIYGAIQEYAGFEEPRWLD